MSKVCNNGSICVYSSVSDSGDTGSKEVTHSAEAGTMNTVNISTTYIYRSQLQLRVYLHVVDSLMHAKAILSPVIIPRCDI